MELHSDYLDLLTRNSTGVTTNSILNLMLSSLVSKHTCKTYRDGFLLANQTNNKTELSNFSTNYLDCHNTSVQVSQKKCNAKYESAIKCLESKSPFEVIPIDCVGNIEDLIQCVNNH